MKRPIYFIGFIAFIIIVLSVVQVSVANSLSTTGSTLSKLQEQIADYDRQNAVLHEQVLAKSALHSIAQSAEKKGFVEMPNAIYFSAPLPLAKK